MRFVCADRIGYDHQQQNQFAGVRVWPAFCFCLFSCCNRRYTVGNFLMYTQESIATTFGITAGTFGATALLDMSLKRI